MVAGISVATTSGAVPRAKHSPFLGPKPAARALRIPPSLRRVEAILRLGRRSPNLTVCFVFGDEKLSRIQESEEEEESGGAISLAESVVERVAEKMARKKSERFSYLVAAVMSSFGVTSMAIMAVYYRFAWQTEVPYIEMFGTFALSAGAVVGMEFWQQNGLGLDSSFWQHHPAFTKNQPSAVWLVTAARSLSTASSMKKLAMRS